MSENEFVADGVSESGQDVDHFSAPDLSPEDYADHWANILANALQKTNLFGVAEVMAGVGQVNVLGRVRREQERMFLDKVAIPILTAMNSKDDLEGFVGKQYMIKDGSVRYAWVVSFASTDLQESTSHVCRAFEHAIPRIEVLESPLMGTPTPQSGGTSTGRKGAATIHAGRS